MGAFYARVEADPVLRPMYPGNDLAPAEERLRLFLEQYWRGPGIYSERRGHPRLRMRHAHSPIDRAASDRWLDHMRAALDEQRLPAELDVLGVGLLRGGCARVDQHRRVAQAPIAACPG